MSSSQGGKLKSLVELSVAVLLRFVLYFALAYALDLYLVLGALRWDFIALSAIVVIIIHEAFHMIGLELFRAEHVESFSYLMTHFTIRNAGWSKTLPVVVLPFVILFPIGFLLITTGNVDFVLVGLVTVVMHAILFPLEVASALLFYKRQQQ